jgi:hypothetical protein
MKKTNLTIALAGLMIAGVALVSSCKKKDTTTPADTNASTAKDNNTAEQNSNDAENAGAEASDNGSLSTFRLAGGGSFMSGTPTITGFGTGTVTVTFPAGYVGLDGHSRSGTLMFTIAGGIHYRDFGMVMTVTTPGNTYFVDGNQVEINKTITNNGLVGGNIQWTITSNLTIIKASGGGTFTWNANRTHVLLNTNAATYDGTSYGAAYTGTATAISWANTASTAPYNGAIIQINGTSSGSDVDGTTFTASSTNVVRNHNCSPDPSRPNFHPFVAGTVDFTPSGKAMRVINYGTGDCDLTYTITIGSVTETFAW